MHLQVPYWSWSHKLCWSNNKFLIEYRHSVTSSCRINGIYLFFIGLLLLPFCNQQGLTSAVSRFPRASSNFKNQILGKWYQSSTCLLVQFKKSHNYSHFLSKVNSTFDKTIFLLNTQHLFIEYPLTIPHSHFFW